MWFFAFYSHPELRRTPALLLTQSTASDWSAQNPQRHLSQQTPWSQDTWASFFYTQRFPDAAALTTTVGTENPMLTTQEAPQLSSPPGAWAVVRNDSPPPPGSSGTLVSSKPRQTRLSGVFSPWTGPRVHLLFSIGFLNPDRDSMLAFHCPTLALGDALKKQHWSD